MVLKQQLGIGEAVRGSTQQEGVPLVERDERILTFEQSLLLRQA